MKFFYKQKNKSGFTLVETLVAVSIFTISILSLMSVLTNGISNTNYAKQKTIGIYLAQEGIEYIRNMRDTFVLYDSTSGQNGWNSFSAKLTTANCQNANGCYFNDSGLDYTNHSQPMAGLTLTTCSSSSCPPLLYDATTGKYNYVTGGNSSFTRKIKITNISADEIRIFSTVFWTQGSGSYSVSFSEDLFNWVE